MIDSILDKAQALGASLAGIARLDETVRAHIELPVDVDPSSQFTWLLVLALAHGEDEPQLDWWGGPGGTEGNRRLQVLSEELKRYLTREAGIRSRVLPYHPWKGGILLKNAVALAGLGVIGANNLLITPQYGPRVRLKAMLVEGLGETGFAPQEPFSSPCDGCPRPCWQACPQEAFASGAYNLARCQRQMQEDEANAGRSPATGAMAYVPYCRACEFACPIGG
jgi:epoxyqueuosine reductase